MTNELSISNIMYCVFIVEHYLFYADAITSLLETKNNRDEKMSFKMYYSPVATHGHIY
jgi:hypothetical protein